MARRGWGLSRRRSARSGDPSTTPGGRELSEWVEISSRDVFDTDDDNPYLPPGTPPQWQSEHEPTRSKGWRARRQQRRAEAEAEAAARHRTALPDPWGTPPEQEPEPRQVPPSPSSAPSRPSSSSASGRSTTPMRPARAGPTPSTRPSGKRGTMRPAQPGPVKPGTGSAAATTSRGGRVGGLIVLALVVLGVVALIVANTQRMPGNLGGPDIANAPTERAELVQLEPVWEAFPSDTMYRPIEGGTYRGLPFALTSDVVVLRMGEDMFEDSLAYGLMALSRADGNIAWELALDGVVCASDLVTLPEPGSIDALACAGERPADAEGPAGERLLLLDPATGEVLVDAPRSGTAASIGTATAGVVVREVAGPVDTGDDPVVGLRWFDTTGTELWVADAAELHEDVRGQFDYSRGEDAIARTEWARIGEALLVGLDGNVLVLEQSGAQVPLNGNDEVIDCWALVVTGESFVCDDWDAVQVVRDDATGTWRDGWRAYAELVGYGVEAPVLLGSTMTDDVSSVAPLDPTTGATGDEIARVRDFYPTVIGTPDVPVLFGGELMIGLSPGGTSGVWRRAFDDTYGNDSVFVAGDRVVYRDYSGDRSQDVVLDAADGHETARLQVGSLWPVEGRQVLSISYDGVRLFELP